MKSAESSKIETLKKKIQYVLAYNGSAPDQIFDGRTYAGCVRFLFFSFLVIYVGWHIDEINRWIGHQFGEELIVAPGKEAWHRVVALGMGTVGIVIGLLDVYKIYTQRPKNSPLALEDKSEAQQSSKSMGLDSIDSDLKH